MKMDRNRSKSTALACKFESIRIQETSHLVHQIGSACILLLLFLLALQGSKLNAQSSYSLEECRQLALANNKRIAIGQEAITEAKAQRSEYFMNFYPVIQATGGYLHMQKRLQLIDYQGLLGPLAQYIPQSVQNLTSPDTKNIYLMNFSLMQPIFAGGKIIASNQMADLAVELKQEMLSTEQQELVYEVDQAYWQAVSVEEKVKLATDFVELLKNSDKTVQALIAAGVATEADALSIAVKLNEAEMALMKAKNGLVLSKMLLAEKCGLAADAITTLSDNNESLSAEQSTLHNSTMEKQIDQIIASRSETKSLMLAEKIYEKNKNIERAAALPQLMFMANYTLMNPNMFNGFRKSFDGTYSVGLLLQVPLTNVLKASYKHRAAEAKHRTKQLERAQAEEQMSLQIRQAQYLHSEAYKQYEVAKSAQRQAEENLRKAQLGYDEGMIALLQVQQAQTAWHSAKTNIIDAAIALRLAKSKLKRVGVN